jgi:hypothetical protein
MQALDSFVSPIPGFEGDIPILTILVSAKPPNGEVDSDSSTGVSADTSRTRAGKRKATANPTPQTKANKAMWKSSGGIKINKLAPIAPTQTPPSGPQKGILIH